MSRKKLIILAILAAIATTGAVLLFISTKDEYPGGVIGDNPANIPKSELPICSFTGAGFVKLPCYSPPGSSYE